MAKHAPLGPLRCTNAAVWAPPWRCTGSHRCHRCYGRFQAPESQSGEPMMLTAIAFHNVQMVERGSFLVEIRGTCVDCDCNEGPL